MKLAACSLAILLASTAAIAAQPQDTAQQPQPDTLAAASRRAREEKKDQPKAAKVWDNDNIPTTPGSVSVVGSVSAPAEEPAEGAPAQQPAPNASTEAKPAVKFSAADLQSAKQQLESLKTDLNILQRKYALDQQMFYGKPNFEADKDGMAALNAEQTQINDKQQQVGELQKKVDEMQAQLGGGDSGSGSSTNSGSTPSSNPN